MDIRKLLFGKEEKRKKHNTGVLLYNVVLFLAERVGFEPTSP